MDYRRTLPQRIVNWKVLSVHETHLRTAIYHRSADKNIAVAGMHAQRTANTVGMAVIVIMPYNHPRRSVIIESITPWIIRRHVVLFLASYQRSYTRTLPLHQSTNSAVAFVTYSAITTRESVEWHRHNSCCVVRQGYVIYRHHSDNRAETLYRRAG